MNTFYDYPKSKPDNTLEGIERIYSVKTNKGITEDAVWLGDRFVYYGNNNYIKGVIAWSIKEE